MLHDPGARMKSQADVTFVTYEGGPDMSADDGRLAEALHKRGLSTRSAVWSDPQVDWSASPITLVRSTWDYFHRPDEFRSWIRTADRHSQLVNPPETLLWNMDKRYLRQVEAAGISIVPTVFAEQADVVDAAQKLGGATEVVIKPTVSGAAFGTRRFNLREDHGEANVHLDAMIHRGGAMVQPYLSAVAGEGERSLVFLGGGFSHAYIKRPFGGMAGSDGLPTIAHTASVAEVTFCESALRASGQIAHYARVDIVPDRNGLLLMELELIEPALFFSARPSSATCFGDYIAGLAAGAEAAGTQFVRQTVQ